MSNKVIRGTFKLVRKERLSANFIRVILHSPEAELFKDCRIGANNKLFIAPKGVNEIHFPTVDPNTGKRELAPEDVRPAIRTYTHRGIDLENNHLIIDFVNHGVNGPASAWAVQAKEGDIIGVAMKGSTRELVPSGRNWYLLVGDATALPVISCILESLPAEARGACYLEVPSDRDIMKLEKPLAFDVNWIINPRPERGSNLATAVKNCVLQEEQSRFAFIATEYSTVKSLRSYFREDKKWPTQDLYAYSYWKAGEAEDRSTAARREERNS